MCLITIQWGTYKAPIFGQILAKNRKIWLKLDELKYFPHQIRHHKYLHKNIVSDFPVKIINFVLFNHKNF